MRDIIYKEKSDVASNSPTELRPTEVKTFKMFIGGEWVDSSDGATITCTDPFNQAPWASVPRATSGDVDRAVAAARGAFVGFSALAAGPTATPTGGADRAQL
jgi:hypothetical protein